MKRIADFIVNKRYLVLGIMAALAIGLALLIPGVKINADMAKYLPDSSRMKQGMELMEQEFPDMELMQTIRVIFRDLDSGEQEKMKERLAEIPYVDSVSHEETDRYNRDGYSLFVLQTPYDYDSPEETSIHKVLKQDFSESGMQFKNDNTTIGVLPPAFFAAAMVMLLIILFAMCGSWAEPFLFLITIGIAVAINMGSNIMFGTISNITASNTAILQLVLSMDYSIILMNRYRQSRKNFPDKAEAMKESLRLSFSSIASSGMTTVAGLLMLVFMSFKIGRDLGFVLAKGVLISMLTVFTVLPGLILIFDKLIRKTAKRSLRIPIYKGAGFFYRSRHIFAAGFAVLFIGSAILQTTTKATYTLDMDDPIAEIFPTDNPVVMLYSNSDEEAAAALGEQLQSDPHVREVLSYGTTIGKACNAAELSEAAAVFSPDAKLDQALMEALIYSYQTNGETKPISAGEFLRFLSEDLAGNPAYSDFVPEDTGDSLKLLGKLSDPVFLTRPAEAGELAELFGMKEEDVQNLFLLHQMKLGEGTDQRLTAAEFSGFIAGNLAQHPVYGKMFDREMLGQIALLQVFSDAGLMTGNRTAAGLGTLFGIEPSQMDMLMVYDRSLHSEPNKLTVPEFAAFLQTSVMGNPQFASYFPPEAAAQIGLMGAVADPAVINAPMTAAQLAELFHIDSLLTEKVLALYHGGMAAASGTMKLAEFSGILRSAMEDPVFAGRFDENTKIQLTAFCGMVDASAGGVPFGSEAMASMTGISPEIMGQIYRMYFHTANLSEKTMTLPQFADFMMTKVMKNPEFSAALSAEQQARIAGLYGISSAAASGQEMSTRQTAELLGIEEALVFQLYAMGFGSRIPDQTMSPYQFVSFLVSEPSFGTVMGETVMVQLAGARQLMTFALEGKDHSAEELAAASGMDVQTVRLLLTYRDYENGGRESWQMTPQELVNFMADQAENLPGMNGAGSALMKTARRIIDGAVKGTSYSAEEMAVLTGIPPEQMKQIFLLYTGNYGDTKGWKMSVQEFVDFAADELLSDPAFSGMAAGTDLSVIQNMQALIREIVENQEKTPAGLSKLLLKFDSRMDEAAAKMLVLIHDARAYGDPESRVSLLPFITYLAEDLLTDPAIQEVLPANTGEQMKKIADQMEAAKKQMQGPEHSILMINTTYPGESDETTAFIQNILDTAADFQGESYLIGPSAMNQEMAASFDREMLQIMLLTAITIFIVVAITFRSLIIPAILVLIVQCGIFITIFTSGILGGGSYYLALLVVQCMLMGATIDYGILFTNYYRESRESMPIQEALTAAYRGSTHTILTSGLIMILVTGILGFSPVDPTIGEICKIISIGALSATMLILFVLPGLLATFDKIVINSKNKR